MERYIDGKSHTQTECQSQTHTHRERMARAKLAKYDVKIGFNFTREIHEPVKRDSHGSKACLCSSSFPIERSAKKRL